MAQVFPPGPNSRIPGGQLFAFRRDPIAFLTGAAQDFGDVAHFRVGSQHYFLVNHSPRWRKHGVSASHPGRLSRFSL